MRNDVLAQYLKRQHPFAKSLKRHLDDTSITSQLLASFEEKWKILPERLKLVHGKDVLAELNVYLQRELQISVNSNDIIDCLAEGEIPDEMRNIISCLSSFATGMPIQDSICP
jgi:hypothetical protein